MNIDSVQAPETAASASQPQEQPEAAKSDQPSAFSKLLSKNGAGKPESEGPAGKPGSKAGVKDEGPSIAKPGVPTPEAPFGAAPIDGTQTVVAAASHTRAPHSIAVPPEIAGVVREITASVDGAGDHQVHIELTSKTLGGLKIQLERHDGKIDIQFQSRTDDMVRLLSRNVNELSQALADRGVQVNEIRVETPQSAARAEEYRPRSRQNDSGKGGQGRGDGQDRQQGRQ